MKRNYILRLALLLFAVMMGQNVKAFTGSGTEGDPYQISSVADWNALAADVANGNDYIGKYFVLTANITGITTTIGCQLGAQANTRKRFAGTFDGDGHTINVNLTSAETNPNYTAPFAYCKGATIKNLKVTGKITTTGTFAGGLVGSSGNNTTDGAIIIDNVEVAVEMNCNYLSGDQGSGKYANQSGFVGIAEGSATITNSWFSGSLTGADFAYSAGFIALNKAASTMSNCLFAPSSVTAFNLYGSSEFFHKNGGNCTLTNCYYTVSFSEPETAQGIKVVTSYNEGDDVTPVNGPDGNTYYIVKHYRTWLDVQEGLARTAQTITLANDITAGTEDTQLVVAAGRNVTLNLNGHTLDRALDIVAARNDGYVIKVEAGGYLTIYGGTIRGGHNKGNGGGIYNAGTLNLDGVTVTGNYASKGAGVYHEGTQICISGNVQINGNHNDNVYLPAGVKIYVYGSFDENTSVGVTTEANEAGTFVAIPATQDITIGATNFFSDNTSFHIAISEDAANLGEPYLSDAPAEDVTLVNNGDNSGTISDKHGTYANVTLFGRTINSGYWNTLCLPFDVTVAQLKSAIGSSIQVNELANASYADGTLTINFAPLIADSKTISAGTPFLVKSADKNSPKFEGVIIKNGQPLIVGDSNVKFHGTYSSTPLEAGNQNIRFLGKNNTLYYPGSNGFTLGANRAYFEIRNGTQVKNFILNFADEDDVTGIENVNVNTNLNLNETIYNLAGQRLNKMHKGINIVNGKKVIIK
jgi:hypothetical protein